MSSITYTRSQPVLESIALSGSVTVQVTSTPATYQPPPSVPTTFGVITGGVSSAVRFTVTTTVPVADRCPSVTV